MNYPPYIDALGWTLLHSLWQGAGLALLYGLLRGCLRGQRPQLRYGLGLITLAALPIWAGLTLWQLWPTELAPLPTSQSSTEPLPTTDIEALMPLLAQPTATGEAGAISWQDRLRPTLPYLGLGYLLGLALMTLRWTGGLWQIYRLRRRATAGPQHWQSQLTHWQRKLGLRRPVRLLISTDLSTPATVGFWKPVILIPASLLTGLSPAQWEAILLHELAHIRRADYLIRTIQAWIEILFFYHPLVWWVGSDLTHEREACCDDQAVGACGDAVGYALALTSLQRMCHPSNLRFAMNLQNKRPSSFTRRMQRLFAPPAPTASPKAGLLLTLMLLVSVAAFGWVHLPSISDSHTDDFLLTIDHTWTRPQLDAKVAKLAERDIVLQIDAAEVDEEGFLTSLSGSLIVPSGNRGTFTCSNLGRIVLRGNGGESPSIAVDCQGDEQFEERTPDGSASTPTDNRVENEYMMVIHFSPDMSRAAFARTTAMLRDKGFAFEVEQVAFDADDHLRSLKGVIRRANLALPIEVKPGEGALTRLQSGEARVSVMRWNGETRRFEADTLTQIAVRAVDRAIKVSPTPPDTLQPLFVIDGQVMPKGIDLGQHLSPKQIQHIEVVKGEDAVAAYGTQGEPGVIVITTKQPEPGEMYEFLIDQYASDSVELDGERISVTAYRQLKLNDKQIKSMRISRQDSSEENGQPIHVIHIATTEQATSSEPTTALPPINHYVVDQKPMSVQAFQALGLQPDDIARVDVRKAGEDESGNPVKVIEVTTKAYQAQLDQPAEDGYFGLKATPNPTEGDLNVELITSTKGRVQVQVYDAQGRFITTLLDGSRPAGVHHLTWQTADMAPGTYLIYAQTAQHRGYQRVLLR